MKIKRMLSSILILALLFSNVTPTCAVSREYAEDPIISNYATSSSDTKGTIQKFEQVGNALYYSEIAESYTLAVGISGNTIDYSIKYPKSPNKVYSGVCTVYNLERKDYNEQQLLNEFRNKLLANELELTENTFNSVVNTRSVNSSDENLIMNELYDAGWPESYVNYLRETRVRSGATGELYHSVTYSMSDYINWFAVATTSLSALISLTNLPAAVLLKVATWSVTAAGVYILVQDVIITRYNVYAYGTKMLYVNDQYEYNAGRTVRWIATVGDIGASLELKSDNKHYDYDDHDSLFSTAFENYFNGI